MDICKLGVCPITLFLFFGILVPESVAGRYEDELLHVINAYRDNNSLPVLNKNSGAECLAEEIVVQIKNRTCTNTTGEGTVPGTESHLKNYPQILARCQINISAPRDGVILTACILDSSADEASKNYTYFNSRYAEYVKNRNYVSAGVVSEDNLFVVVMATNSGFHPHVGGQEKLSSFSLIFLFIVLCGGLIL